MRQLGRFGVWGLGFGVWGLGVGIWSMGFGVNPKPHTPIPVDAQHTAADRVDARGEDSLRRNAVLEDERACAGFRIRV